MHDHHIDRVRKLTDHPYLNMYALDIHYSSGRKGIYQVASRAREIEGLKLRTRQNRPDGVLIYSVFGEQRDRVVLIRQYRYSLDDYIYEFPAGLIEPGETYMEAGIRELREETGLTLSPLPASPAYTRPYFTTVGMTDESCAAVYGYASGTPSERFQEASEDIRVVLADREEIRRILREENVAIMCAYMLMHFLRTPEGEEPFSFLNLA